MSDSGSSQFPQNARPALGLVELATQRAKITAEARVEKASGELVRLQKPLRIEGEVTHVSEDGRKVTLRTEKGNLQLESRQRIPVTEGQKIVVDLPSGQPPAQVTLTLPPVTPQTRLPEQSLPTPGGSPYTPPAQVGQTEESSSPTRSALSPDEPDVIIAETLRQKLLPAFPPDLAARILLYESLQDLTVAAPRRPLPVGESVRLVPLPALPGSIPSGPEPFMGQGIPQTKIQAEPGSQLFPKPDFLKIPEGLSSPAFLRTLQVVNSTLSALGSTLTIFQGIQKKTGNDSLPATTTQPTASPPAQAVPGDGLASSGLPQIPGAFDARIISVTPPSRQQKPPSVDSYPAQSMHGSLKASVISVTQQNHPVLTIGFHPDAKTDFFIMQFPADNTPVGTQIRILPQPEIATLAASPESTGITATTPASLTLSGLTGPWTWPAFEEIPPLLVRQGMPDAVQSFTNMIPNPANPAKMPSAMLFLFAAIRAGDAAGWMGEKTLNILKRDGQRGIDIVSRMTRDFSNLGQVMNDTATQDWKSMAMPLAWQNEIQKIYIHYRKQGHDGKEPGKGGNGHTRFIFDLYLDRMGNIQLDGLMRGKRLDLILRTQENFSHGMQTAIRKKYLDVLESGNLTGDLSFQHRADQFVKVESRRAALTLNA